MLLGPPSASIDANFFGDDASDFTDLSPRQTRLPVGKPGPRVKPHVWALTTDATRDLSGERVDLPLRRLMQILRGRRVGLHRTVAYTDPNFCKLVPRVGLRQRSATRLR